MEGVSACMRVHVYDNDQTVRCEAAYSKCEYKYIMKTLHDSRHTLKAQDISANRVKDPPTLSNGSEVELLELLETEA
ncbi:hypothetical protein NDU88_006202 [Pleurodeles waltl]|uniref:Uncharacterized protein n=1 Tax=Pleurodeles waltl TaxID=8319 RepID=A0AAV7WEV8_PLEWA|nr:hypothetical protein NDU88_006202 [Pleurodeles waltl]